MGQLILDLSNPENWEQVYDESRLAEVASPAGGFFPIPAFEIPLDFNQNIIAVRCLSTTAKATWRFAGALVQRISIPIAGNNSPPVETLVLKMRVNRTRLITLPTYTTNYELVLEPPVWFKSLRLTVWSYLGDVGDSTELLINDVWEDVQLIKNEIIT